MVLQILLLIVGFVLLIKGADLLIDGASSTASHFKVSKLLIGLTILAFGTSAPELAVSISSLISGNTDMLIGNVIGSNIINILLLVGIAAIIHPIRVKKNTTVKKELPLLILISAVFIVLLLDMSLADAETNLITRGDGLICLLFFCIFLYYIINMTRKNHKASATKDKTEVEPPKHKLGISILLIFIGLAGVAGGSELVVSSASNIATSIGISERIIALTVVALGTSLPELVTTISAARKGETELLIGNIVGSNIFNICIVLGLPVAIFGSVTPESFQIIDIAVFMLATIVLWLFARIDQRISRLEGTIMVLIFLAYYGYIIYGALA
ncbi:calcium/sodium antiporter [Candidatus Saccharibacteria bacterium]|nr:calcium/sodium antiporter [Candidatus Saccharibacteria bacterium]